MSSITLPDLIFYGVAAVTVLSAAYAVFSRNLVRAVFSLLATFFCVAILYGMLAADFVAVVQLMVYVGGILVLMLFAVMLTSRIEAVQRSNLAGNWVIGVLVGGGAAALLVGIAILAPWHERTIGAATGTTERLGTMLVNQALLPFLVLALVLMASVIGGVTLARRRRGGREGGNP